MTAQGSRPMEHGVTLAPRLSATSPWRGRNTGDVSAVPSGRGPKPRPAWRPPQRPLRPGKAVAWLLLTVLAVASFHGIAIDWRRIGDLPAQIVQYSVLMFTHPDWTKFGEAAHQTLLSVEMAWLGTVLGALIATPLSFLASRGFSPRWIVTLLRAVFSLIRAVPEVVLAIILLTVTGLTPFTGALTLVLTSIGTLGKWGYEAVERADDKPIEATRSVGATTWQILRWGVWPDVAPEFLSFWLYRFEVNVRASAVLGLIGAGGIGDMLSSYVQYRQWPVIGVLLIVVVVVTMAVDAVSQTLRKRIVEG